MPPQYVKPYVKRNKNDAADAEAIGEAVQGPSMRFVPIKPVDQQAILVLHRSRDLLVRQRTALVNALRGHLVEFSLVEAQGIRNVPRLAALLEETDSPVPPVAHGALKVLLEQITALSSNIDALEADIRVWHAEHPHSKRLASIPGIGAVVATAIAATVPDPSMFASGRADPWVASLLARKPRLVVAVALANKIARIAWAVMTRNENLRPARAAAA